MIVLDTNVISEVLRPAPEPEVLSWLRSVPRREIWTCTVVLAELFSGVDLMPTGKRQQLLREKMEQLVPTLFMDQILPFDLSSARAMALYWRHVRQRAAHRRNRRSDCGNRQSERSYPCHA